MKKVLIIFGNITFDELIDGTPCAIIHEVTETVLVNDDYANHIADALLNTYDSFVIPSQYTKNGTIIWE